MWDTTRFTIGILLVVVLPSLAFGGVPWTAPIFLALIGFEIWRRRRYLQRIAGNLDLLAADRRSQLLGAGAAIAAIGSFLLMGAAVGSGSESLGFLSLVVMATSFALFWARAITSGERIYLVSAVIGAVITVVLFLRQTFQLW